MSRRLNCLLGSNDNRDEFQIGQLIVWVEYDPTRERSSQLEKAEALFPLLEADIPEVEELITTALSSSVKATAIGLLICPNGSSSYQCTFFGGSHDDQFVNVGRTAEGTLFLDRT